MAFVDYEYWFYSMKTRYHLQPNPAAWRAELEKTYNLADIMVFADFSSPGLSGEPDRLRDITNTIIETGSASPHRKKDMTDFVMLDYIYQCVNERPDVGTYILFTGDGHFHSVVKYLVQKRRKKVIVYGIEDSFSSKFAAVATDTVMISTERDLYKKYRRLIIEDMAYVSQKDSIIPTFNGTIDAVARKNEVPADEIRSVLTDMMEKGYLYQRYRRVEFNKQVKIVAANWEKLIADGLWDPNGKAI